MTTSTADDPPGAGGHHRRPPGRPGRAAHGRPLPAPTPLAGQPGELLVRGPELFVGYDDPAATAAAFVDDGWFRTGDLATLDDDGWLTIVGRIKDVIIRGGENIATVEIESVLEAHPDVREAVAVGEPDERLGERVCAFVVVERPLHPRRRAAAWFDAARGHALQVARAGRGDRRAAAARVGQARQGGPARPPRAGLISGLITGLTARGRSIVAGPGLRASTVVPMPRWPHGSRSSRARSAGSGRRRATGSSSVAGRRRRSAPSRTSCTRPPTAPGRCWRPTTGWPRSCRGPTSSTRCGSSPSTPTAPAVRCTSRLETCRRASPRGAAPSSVASCAWCRAGSPDRAGGAR